MVLSADFSGKGRARNWHRSLYRQRLRSGVPVIGHMGIEQWHYKPRALNVTITRKG